METTRHSRKQLHLQPPLHQAGWQNFLRSHWRTTVSQLTGTFCHTWHHSVQINRKTGWSLMWTKPSSIKFYHYGEHTHHIYHCVVPRLLCPHQLCNQATSSHDRNDKPHQHVLLQKIFLKIYINIKINISSQTNWSLEYWMDTFSQQKMLIHVATLGNTNEQRSVMLSIRKLNVWSTFRQKQACCPCLWSLC